MKVSNYSNSSYYIYQRDLNNKLTSKKLKRNVQDIEVNFKDGVYIKNKKKYLEIIYYLIVFIASFIMMFFSQTRCFVFFLFLPAAFLFDQFLVVNQYVFFIVNPKGHFTINEDYSFNTDIKEAYGLKRIDILYLRYFNFLCLCGTFFDMLLEIYFDIHSYPFLVLTIAFILTFSYLIYINTLKLYKDHISIIKQRVKIKNIIDYSTLYRI